MPIFRPQNAVFPAAPRRAFLFGESSMQNNLGFNAAGGYGFSINGYVGWFNRLAGQPLQLSSSNYYCGLYNSNQLLAALPAQVLAKLDKFDIIFMNLLDNDAGAGIAPAVSLANAKATVAPVMAAGKWVVLFAVMPWNPGSATQLKQTLWLNQQLREWARSTSWPTPFFLIDVWRDIADPASATGQWAANLAADAGVDPGPGGAYLIAKRLNATLGPFLAPTPDLAIAQADVYDATYNPLGNLLTNGSMATLSGGSIQSGAATGVLAASWGFNKVSGNYAAANVVLSTAANPAGYDAPPGGTQTITVDIPAGATSNEQFMLQQWSGALPCAVGDTIYAGAEMTLSNVAHLWGAGVTIVSQNDGQAGVGDGGSSSPAAPFYPGNYPKQTLRTPPMTVTSAMKSNVYLMRFLFNFDASGATDATATIAITGCFVRKLSP